MIFECSELSKLYSLRPRLQEAITSVPYAGPCFNSIGVACIPVLSVLFMTIETQQLHAQYNICVCVGAVPELTLVCVWSLAPT